MHSLILVSELPNETIQQLQTPLQQEMDLNVHSIQKQHPSVLQHHVQQQPQITIHQLPISNTVVSYSDMVNSSSTSTIHIPTQQIVGNPPASVLSSNVNPGSSVHPSSVTLNAPSIGLTVLSDSNQVALKAEYTEPKTEYT